MFLQDILEKRMISVQQNLRGFTLIELLVVIAIIGMLSSMVLASLNSARSKSRDARRASDLHQLQVAIELYASSNGSGSFPVTANSTVAGALTVLVPTYMSVLPKDPKGPEDINTGYRYCADSNGYALLAHPERAGAYWCGIMAGNNACNWAQYIGPCK